MATDDKKFTVATNGREPRPRSKRLRATGVARTGGGSYGAAAVFPGAAASDPDSHRHENKAVLDRIGADGDNYMTLSTFDEEANAYVPEKVKAGYADKAHDLDDDAPVLEKYLRKDRDDAAEGNIAFNKGITVKEDASVEGALHAGGKAGLRGGAEFGPSAAEGGSVSEDGAAAFRELALREALTVAGKYGIDAEGLATLASAVIAGMATAKGVRSAGFRSGFDGEGYTLDLSEGDSYLEVDRLLVRKLATFVELMIQKISHAGGTIILTPASMKVSRVEDAGDAYRCRFDSTDGDRTVENEFRAGDLARAQTFNVGAGADKGAKNTYYWRLVVAVGDDYIDLSKDDCDEGSGVPAAGDEIVQLGNRTEPERQGAVILSSYDTSGDGAAPYIRAYRGIKDYSFPDPFFDVSRKAVRITADVLSWSSGRTMEEYVRDAAGEAAREAASGAAQDAADAKAAAEEARGAADAAREKAESAKEAADAATGGLASAREAAEQAEQAARDAASRADSASEGLADVREEMARMKRDDVVSPQEKNALRVQRHDVRSEHGELAAEAEAAGVDASAYEEAYSKADAAFAKYTAEEPEYIPVEDDFDDIGGYYEARLALAEAVNAAARAKADKAIEKADKAASDAARAGHYVLDLSAETAPVPCDADGTPAGSGILASTTATVYYGTGADGGWSLSAEAAGCAAQVSGMEVSVTAVAEDVGRVTVTAAKEGCPELSAVFSVYKVVPGKQGAKGDKGDGVTVKSSTVTYQASDGGTEAPTGEWTADVPPVGAGQYLWTRTVTAYSDGKSTTAYSVSRNGTNGSNGTNGTGVTVSSASVTYALTDSPAQPADDEINSAAVPELKAGSYLWSMTVVKYSDGKSTKAYSVSRIGADGKQGDAGSPGADGKTPYVHYAYADSADGKEGFSLTYSDGKAYVGRCTDYAKDDPTDYAKYTWARLKGDTGAAGSQGSPGKGIKSIAEKYAVSASNTTAPTTWSDAVPTLTATNKYLWNYEIVTYTDSTTTETAKRVIGVYGDTGKQGEKGKDGTNGTNGTNGSPGKGIKSIAEKYAVSTSNTTAPTTWSDTVPTLTATNKYLWNYEIVTYTDSTTTETAKRVIGVYGDTGKQGEKGKDGTNGTNGTNGSPGKGIKSIAEKYAVSASNTTAPTTWSDTVPTLTATNKYLWNYEIVTYTDGTATETAKRVIGVYGDTGKQGDKGDTGVAEWYAIETDIPAIRRKWDGTYIDKKLTARIERHRGDESPEVMKNYTTLNYKAVAADGTTCASGHLGYGDTGWDGYLTVTPDASTWANGSSGPATAVRLWGNSGSGGNFNLKEADAKVIPILDDASGLKTWTEGKFTATDKEMKSVQSQVQGIADAQGEMDTALGEMRTSISQKADQIEFESTFDGILDELDFAAEERATLTQNYNSLTSTVKGLDGKYSKFEQTLENIKLEVGRAGYENLFVDGTFETDYNDGPAYKANMDAAPSTDTSSKQFGTRSKKYVFKAGVDGYAYLPQCVKTEPGTTYTLVFWARSSVAGSPHTADLTTMETPGGVNKTHVRQTFAPADTSFNRYALKYQVPDGSHVRVAFGLLNAAKAATLWVDGLMLLKGDYSGNPPGEYVPSLGDRLLPTGVDICGGRITVTSDKFEVRNNAGEVTARINEEGVLSVSSGEFSGFIRTVPRVITRNTGDIGDLTYDDNYFQIDLRNLYKGGFVYVDSTSNSYMGQGIRLPLGPEYAGARVTVMSKNSSLRFVVTTMAGTGEWTAAEPNPMRLNGQPISHVVMGDTAKEGDDRFVELLAVPHYRDETISGTSYRAQVVWVVMNATEFVLADNVAGGKCAKFKV